MEATRFVQVLFRNVGLVLLLALPTLLPEAQPSSTTSRIQELNLFVTRLPKLDPNFFSQLFSFAFQQEVNTLQANIATLTDAQFYVGLA